MLCFVARCALCVDCCLWFGGCGVLGVWRFESCSFVVLCRFVSLRVVGCGALFVVRCLLFVS